MFRVSPLGDVIVVKPLDREVLATYSLTLEAFDNGGRVSAVSATLDIMLQDVNDNVPGCTQSAYSGTLPEDATPGDQV